MTDLSYIHPQLRGLAVPIETVKPDPANARQHGRKNKQAIAGSLAEFQQRKPIVVRRDTMQIEAGNGTWEQGRALGWTHIAAVVCDDDEARAAAYALADNRTSDLSAWAKDNLAATLRKLTAAKLPLDKLGFTADDVAKRLAAKPPSADPNEMLSRFNAQDRAIMEGMAGFRTAQNRGAPSVPMAYYQAQGLLTGRVLDFGCGRDVPPTGIRVARYDPAYQPNLDALAVQYDTITLNYVLNVIPLEALRAQVLMACRALLKPGGRLLIAVYRKDEQDSKSAAGYQCGWSPEQWEDLIGRWYEGRRLPAAAGFLGWECRPCRMIGRIPGKEVAGRLYFHRSALDLQPARVQDAVAQAERVASGWAWDVARVIETPPQVALVKCPDWNEAPEPTVGVMVVVDLGPDTQGPRIVEPTGLIYHHKWQFVADDYDGFDVEESKARSAAWQALEPQVDRSKIGRREYWERVVLPRLDAPSREQSMFAGFE